MSKERKIYATFFGDAELPVEWKDDVEKDLMWFYDDLHCPNPISPLYFDIGGWWGPTCEYLYRRFGAPIGRAWIAKKIGGYVYTAVVPPNTDEDKIGGLFAYFSTVMPIYADQFLDRWNKEYIPDLLKWGEYMTGFDWANKSIPEMLIHMEDCLDLQERAFRIHWIMNLAQVGASQAFQGAYKDAIGAEDDDLSKITISSQDRNWDSLRELWKIKEAIVKNAAAKDFFLNNECAAIMKGIKGVSGGEELFKMFEAYRKEYGFKAIYSHEYIHKTWFEDPTPIYEAVKGYIQTDYNFNTHYDGCIKSQNEAIERARGKIKDPAQLKNFNEKLNLCLKMMPLTPNHHFYIDQSIYSHMRIMFRSIGEALVKAGKLDDAEDIFMLEYEEIRCLGVSDYPVKDKVKQRRADMAAAAKRHPRYWYGTVDHWQLYEEIYKGLWGYPQIFDEEMKEKEGKAAGAKNQIKGIPGSAGVVEGVARVVATPKEFDQLKKGEIMICKMTNPAWILSFSKISGLVTDTGGALAHPAVVSREFGIPCVVGTAKATKLIKTGDRIKVDGSSGIVEILS
jgi:pyruvate,water dikinase